MRIVVTGFGPFGTFQANPSTEVVNGLAAGFDYEPVELIVQTVPVEYGEALKCSRMACEELEAEFVIHVGVQPFWGQLCLETRSFSHGYISPDVKGMVPLLNCCEAKPKTNENVQPKEAAAKTLNTSIDCEQLKQNVLAAFEGKKEELPVQIKISDDPGRFLCAYIYYYSLLHTNGRCLFVHIPPFDEECTPAVLIAALKQIIFSECRMGKRRGSDEEDAGDPATTTSKINIKRELLGGEAEQQGTSSSGQPQQQKAHPKPFKRAKLEPFDWDNEMYGNLTAEVPRNTPLVNGHGSTAVSPAKRRLNGEHVEEQVPAEFQTVWLVRKPRNIPLEDLHKIRFTRKSKHRVQTVHGGCDMQCVMEAPPHTMMHLQCPEKSFGDQKAEMEPANSLRGIVQITEKLANSNPSGQMPSPADEEDDALFMSEPQNKAINTEVLAISTIRRKPREEGEEQCRERLQAYGCAETDHHPYLDEEDDDDEEEVGRTANRPKHWNIKEEKRI